MLLLKQRKCGRLLEGESGGGMPSGDLRITKDLINTSALRKSPKLKI